MKEPLKYFLERTTPFGTLARLQRQKQLLKKFRKWQKKGAQPPMPNWGKQRVVIDYITKFLPAVFIETGTYKGKMIYAVMPHIKEIYSIELDQTHFENAHKRFIGYPNIHILQGPSEEVLPRVLANIDKPCLFWLDAHWSEGSTAKGKTNTPILQELQCILNYKKADEHIVLIDDARLFIGMDDYPTLEALEHFVRAIHPNWIFDVKDDIIKTHSNKPTQRIRHDER